MVMMQILVQLRWPILLPRYVRLGVLPDLTQQCSKVADNRLH